MNQRRNFHNILPSGFGRKSTEVLVRSAILSSQLASDLELFESFPILHVENKDNACHQQEDDMKIRYHLQIKET